MLKLHRSITATELVRSLSRIIDEVRITGESIYITKGSQIVAELAPPPKAGYPIEKLPEFLGSLPKLGKDSIALFKAVSAIRKQANLPKDPWE